MQETGRHDLLTGGSKQERLDAIYAHEAKVIKNQDLSYKDIIASETPKTPVPVIDQRGKVIPGTPVRVDSDIFAGMTGSVRQNFVTQVPPEREDVKDVSGGGVWGGVPGSARSQTIKQSLPKWRKELQTEPSYLPPLSSGEIQIPDKKINTANTPKPILASTDINLSTSDRVPATYDRRDGFQNVFSSMPPSIELSNDPVKRPNLSSQR